METQKKRIIGITGGVGAGKSTVLALLREKFGADVFLADTCAHELMEPGTRGLEQVVQALGGSFLAPDGSVDKKALAQRIFHDKEALRTMNAIIHPLVWETLGKGQKRPGAPWQSSKQPCSIRLPTVFLTRSGMCTQTRSAGSGVSWKAAAIPGKNVNAS